MKDLFTKMPSFLEEVWDRKVWVIATTVFTSCVWYVYNTITILPNTFKANYASTREARIALSEGAQIDRSFKQLKEQIAASHEVAMLYEDHFAGKPFNSGDDSAADQGIAMCIMYRRELSSAIGYAEGLRLQTPDYQDFINGQVLSFQQLDKLLESYKAFFIATKNPDVNARKSAADELARNQNLILNSLLSRVITGSSGNSV